MKMSLTHTQMIHLPFQQIKFNALSYSDAYGGFPSLVSSNCLLYYEQLKQYDGHGRKITKAHALNIGVSFTRQSGFMYSIKNYIVEIEGHHTRVSPDMIVMLENGEEIKERGDSVLETYKQWTQLSKACLSSKHRDPYLLPQPWLEGVTNDLFELHEQLNQGSIAQPRTQPAA